MLSPGLRRLLVVEPDNNTAIEAIATDPAALAEAEAVLPSLEREARRPSGPEGVRHVVGRRFALYPQSERSDSEWAAWWSDYVAILGDVPLETLEAAMLAWCRTAADFLPKPGQLLELTRDRHGESALAAYRIRAAKRWSPPVSKPVYIEGTERDLESEAARRKAMAGEIKAIAKSFSMAVPEKPKPQWPGKPAPVDETGISAEMRELLAKQRGEG